MADNFFPIRTRVRCTRALTVALLCVVAQTHAAPRVKAASAPAERGHVISGRASVLNEGTVMPYHALVTTPIHPGLQLGAEVAVHESRWIRLAPSLDAGYLYHRPLFHGAYLGISQGLDVKFPYGPTLKLALGAAYLHTFSTSDEYQFKDGKFQSGRDSGNPRFMPSFSLGLGYRLTPELPDSPQVFVSYQTWLEWPYSPGFIPMMAHASLHFGLTLPLGEIAR